MRRFARMKCFSLFSQVVSDDGKKFITLRLGSGKADLRGAKPDPDKNKETCVSCSPSNHITNSVTKIL